MALSEDVSLASLDGASAVRERRTTQELVFEFLRDAILSGRLRGGAHLVQDKIAQELNVSRVPVREALLQLESEGLVRMEAHRGASVIWLSPDQIQELFEIRAVLAVAAARRAVPNLTDDQIRRLEQNERRQESETNMAARVRLIHAFYQTLFENLDRPRWRTMMDKLEREVERYLMPLDRPLMGHGELVEGCRLRDGDRVAGLVGEHLARVSERAVARVRELLESGEAHLPPRPSPRRRRGTSATSPATDPAVRIGGSMRRTAG